MITSYTTIESYIGALVDVADADFSRDIDSYSAALYTYFKQHPIQEPGKTLVDQLITVIRWRIRIIHFFEENLLPQNGFFKSYSFIYKEVYANFQHESVFYRESISGSTDVEKSKEFYLDRQLQTILSAKLKKTSYADIKPSLWKDVIDRKDLMRYYGRGFIELYPTYFRGINSDTVEQLGKLIFTVNYVMGPLTMRAIENIRSDRHVELTSDEKYANINDTDVYTVPASQVVASVVSSPAPAPTPAPAPPAATQQSSPLPPPPKKSISKTPIPPRKQSCVTVADVEKCKQTAAKLQAQLSSSSKTSIYEQRREQLDREFNERQRKNQR